MTRRTLALALTLTSSLLAPSLGWAGCTTDDEARAARTTVRKAAQCNDRLLKGRTCSVVPPPPACSESLTADAIALAYGPNDPPAAAASGSEVSAQRRCQTQIGKGVADFVKRLYHITRGKTPAEAETLARKQLDRVPLKCGGVTVAQHSTGVILPAVGPQCAAAVGGPGDTVDGTALRDCLLRLMRTWIDRVVPDPQPLRPNIILILSDDQRWDTTDDTHSPSGGFVMPRLRAELGGSGVELTRGYMTTPLCCPSRASILMGQYAHRTGVYSNGGTNGGADDFLTLEASAIGALLDAAGYRTGYFGKYLNGYNALWADPAPPHVPPGWDEWHAFVQPKYFDYELVRNGIGFDHVIQAYGSADADYSTDVLRELVRNFIVTSVGMGEPFFVHLGVKAPHGPWEPAPRHAGKYAGIPPWRPPSWNEADVSDKPAWVQATPLMNSTQQASLDAIRQAQLEMVQAVDELIGGSTTYGITGIMQTLRDLGVADDTIVIYFADNGWQWGEHRMRAKNKPYEESIRSPMFVRYPALAPLPRTEAGFALNIDLAPTLADLAGAAVPHVQDGVSLVRLLDGTAPAWRTDFLTEGWPGDHVWATVHEGQWKYTELPTDPGNPLTTFEVELYDLASDPYELTNVAGDPGNATRIAAMAARLRELRPNWPLDADPTVELPED